MINEELIFFLSRITIDPAGRFVEVPDELADIPNFMELIRAKINELESEQASEN